MSKIMEFAYRIGKEANLAYDTETGEPTECYTKIRIDGCRENITEEEYKESHRALIKELEIPLKFITPISLEEYERETSEE